MKRPAPTPNRLPVFGALALLILLSAAGNLFWIDQNVVQVGHDASAHLSRTLKMAAAMTEPTLAAFLRGLTVTDFRPPGLYMAAQPFYQLFGRSIDSAQLANVAIMALILLFTFLLADRLLAAAPPAARALLALLAAALAALLPMLLAMSRLFYAETLVTLCVVAALYFMLKSEGFARRSWSLALGAALGVGMLAKWTLPVYLAAPLLLAIWFARDGLLAPLRRQPVRGCGHEVRDGEVDGAGARHVSVTLSLAVLAAAGVALLLYWPDRDYWAQTLLGPWLLPAWFVTWLALFVLLALPSSPLTNLLAGLALGAAIAGLWYLPQAGFALTLSEVAFGTGEGDYKPADWSSQNQYTRYFRFFYQHHTGLLIALAILPAGLWPWLRRLGKGGAAPARQAQAAQPTEMGESASDTRTHSLTLGALTEMSDTRTHSLTLGALTEMSDTRTHSLTLGALTEMAHVSNILPQVDRRWLPTGQAVLLIWVAALSPFLILIFTSQTSSRNLVPILPLFALLMAVGLLAYAPRVRALWAALWLGVLLLHWALVTFDSLAGVRSATDPLWPGQEYSVAPASGITDPAWWIVPDVLAQIAASGTQTTTLGVLLDTAQLHPGSFEYPILAQGQAVDLASLTGPDLRGPRDVIANQWVLVKDGDNGEMKAPQQAVAAQLLEGAPWFSSLYRRVQSYPFPNGETAYLYHREVGPADPLQFSTIMQEDAPAIAAAVNRWWSEDATLAFTTAETAVWLGTQEIPIERAIIPQPGSDLQPDDLAGVQRTLIVVAHLRVGEFQEWLGQRFRPIEEVTAGDFSAMLYGRVDQPLEPLAVEASWPAVSLASLHSRREVNAGDPLPIDLSLAGQLDGTWKLSARLLDASGALVSQQDTAALPGTAMLTLFVPPGAAPGAYALHMIVYNGETLAPAADSQGRLSTPLAVITVNAPAAAVVLLESDRD